MTMVPFTAATKDLSDLFTKGAFPHIVDKIFDNLDIRDIFYLVEACPNLKKSAKKHLRRTLRSPWDMNADALRIIWRGKKNGILMGTSETDELILPRLPDFIPGELEAIEVDAKGMIMLHEGSITAFSSLKFFNPEIGDSQEVLLKHPKFRTPALEFNESVVAIYEPGQAVLISRKEHGGATRSMHVPPEETPVTKVLKDGTNGKMYLIRDRVMSQLTAPDPKFSAWYNPRRGVRAPRSCRKLIDQLAVDNDCLVMLCQSCLKIGLSAVEFRNRKLGLRILWQDVVQRIPDHRDGYKIRMERGIIVLEGDAGRILEMRIADTNARFRYLDYGEGSRDKVAKILVTDKYILELHERVQERESEEDPLEFRTQLYLSKRDAEENTIAWASWGPYLWQGKVEDVRIVAEDILVVALRVPKKVQEDGKDSEEIWLIPFDLSARNPFGMQLDRILHCDEKMSICRITPDGRGYVMGNSQQILGHTSYWYHKKHFNVWDLCKKL